MSNAIKVEVFSIYEDETIAYGIKIRHHIANRSTLEEAEAYIAQAKRSGSKYYIV